MYFFILAQKIRLTHSYQGYIEIHNGSKWRLVKERNWDTNREKMLCQHLGFRGTDKDHTGNKEFAKKNYRLFLTGDLMCYNQESNRKSCCVNLVPVKITPPVQLPYVRCEYMI